MTLTVKVGSRLFDTASTAEFIVVRAPSEEIDLTISGNTPAFSADGRAESVAPKQSPGETSIIGKRYVDDAGTIELLCCRAGDGTPAVSGSPLQLKEAKPLPSSD